MQWNEEEKTFLTCWSKIFQSCAIPNFSRGHNFQIWFDRFYDNDDDDDDDDDNDDADDDDDDDDGPVLWISNPSFLRKKYLSCLALQWIFLLQTFSLNLVATTAQKPL